VEELADFLSPLPGIEDGSAGPGEILYVAGNQGEIVFQRSSRDQTVSNGKLSSAQLCLCRKIRPSVRDRPRHRQQASSKRLQQIVRQPFFQLSAALAEGEKGNATPNLRESQNAREKSFAGGIPNPVFDAQVWFALSREFGQNVGI
jgi:hypothetical protein